MPNQTSPPSRGATWLWPLAVLAVASLALVPLVTLVLFDRDALLWFLRALMAAVALAALGAAAMVGPAIWTRLASPKARKAATRIALAEAQHMRLPDDAKVTISIAPPRPAALAELPALPAPAIIEGEVAAPPTEAPALPALAPGRPALAQLRERGHICRSGNSLLVGYSAAQPQYLEMSRCGLLIIAGQSRKGKTSTGTFLAAQAALMGWDLILCDYFPDKPDGLMRRCAPFSGRIAERAGEPASIAQKIRKVDLVLRRRLNGEAWRRPLLILVDEFSNAVMRGWVPDDLVELMAAMAMNSAVAGVHLGLLLHDASRDAIGNAGAVLRRAVTHQIVHGLAPDGAGFLLPAPNYVRQVVGLPAGQALYWGEESPVPVEVPYLGSADLAYAAQGAPEVPYVPRPVLSLTSAATPAPTLAQPSLVAPTEPLPPPLSAPPRAAPDTVRLFSSVDEAIVECLTTEGGWLDPDAIARGIGANPGSLKNNLTRLAKAGKVRRRDRKPSGYEYAAPPVPTA